MTTTELTHMTYNMTSSYDTNVTLSPSILSSSCLKVNLTALTLTLSSSSDLDLVSRETADLFSRVKEGVVVPALFVLGFPSNCLNMVVFFRQSLRQRINLCLFTLALVDIVFVTFVFARYWDSLGPNGLPDVSSNRVLGAVQATVVTSRLTSLYGFAYASMFVSAVIAAERCFCVVMPLHSQTLLQTKTMAVILAAGVGVSWGVLYYINGPNAHVICVYDVSTGLTLLRRAKKPGYSKAELQLIDILDSIVYGIAIPIAAIVVVAVATTVTAVKLVQSARFRAESSSSSVDAVSSKERALTTMLIYLSIQMLSLFCHQFIVLNLPMGAFKLARRVYPDFNFTGPLGNTFEVVAGMSELFLVVSSATNFLVYALAGSKYRRTVRGLFKCKRTCGVLTKSAFELHGSSGVVGSATSVEKVVSGISGDTASDVHTE